MKIKNLFNGAKKQMKKIVPIAIIAVLVIIIGGFFVFKKVSDDKKNEAKNPIAQEKIETEGDKEEGEKSSGIIDELAKIKDGKKMKCVYTIKMGEDEFQSESYVQGDKYKSISVMDALEEKKTYVIFDGENQYSWTDGAVEGFKMNADCMEDTAEELEDAVDVPETAELGDLFENAVDVKCNPVEEIDFTVPSNITFVDQCEMLKNQMKQIEELKGGLPAGFTLPTTEE